MSTTLANEVLPVAGPFGDASPHNSVRGDAASSRQYNVKCQDENPRFEQEQLPSGDALASGFCEIYDISSPLLSPGYHTYDGSAYARIQRWKSMPSPRLRTTPDTSPVPQAVYTPGQRQHDPPLISPAFINTSRLIFPGERDALSIALDQYLKGRISAGDYHLVLNGDYSPVNGLLIVSDQYQNGRISAGDYRRAFGVDYLSLNKRSRDQFEDDLTDNFTVDNFSCSATSTDTDTDADDDTDTDNDAHADADAGADADADADADASRGTTNTGSAKHREVKRRKLDTIPRQEEELEPSADYVQPPLSAHNNSPVGPPMRTEPAVQKVKKVKAKAQEMASPSPVRSRSEDRDSIPAAIPPPPAPRVKSRSRKNPPAALPAPPPSPSPKPRRGAWSDEESELLYNVLKEFQEDENAKGFTAQNRLRDMKLWNKISALFSARVQEQEGFNGKARSPNACKFEWVRNRQSFEWDEKNGCEDINVKSTSVQGPKKDLPKNGCKDENAKSTSVQATKKGLSKQRR